jgi:hypothetical protein
MLFAAYAQNNSFDKERVMKKLHNIIAMLAIAASMAPGAWATVNFGSENSGFTAAAGTLALGTITLSNGMVRDAGGTVSGTVTASGMTFETKDGTTTRKMTTDGTVVVGTSISLGNNQILNANGGSFVENVTVTAAAATPAIMQGFGAFDAVITVNDEAQLNMRWNGVLNQNIDLNAAGGSTSTLLLEQDLQFGVGKFVTATDTANATDLVDFNGYKISFGGDESTTTSIANSQSWANPNVSLSGPASLAASKTVTLTSAGYINGQGNRFTFGSGSVLANDEFAVTFDDIILSGLTSASLAGTGDWTFVQSRLEGSNSAIEIDGSITSSTVDVFGGATTFGASTISLMTDVTPGGTWTLGGALTINGNGNVFNCSGSGKKLDLGPNTLRLENITLAEVEAESIDADAGQTVYLSNVNWLGTTGGSIRVTGMDQTTTTQGAATLTLASSETAGNIFATAVTWTTGANIELLADTALNATWTFAEHTVINGNGRHLDLTDGVLKIADSKTLTLRDVVLDNVASASLFDDADFTGILNLSNVTIILNGADVTWSGTVVVDGPLTVVTGANIFTGSDMTLNGVTVYYDTLSTTNNSNLVVSTPNSGRVVFINSAVPVISGTTTLAANADLTSNVYLFPTDGGIPGRTINVTDDVTYDGHTRSLVFPRVDGFGGAAAVVAVDDTKTLTTVNMTLDGLIPEYHLDLNTSGAIVYGNGTIIRLQSDIVVDAPLNFGTVSGTDIIELDLNGFSVIMSTGGEINLSTAGNQLLIKNGRIIDLEGTMLTLDTVELVLKNEATWAAGELYFAGHCAISGIAGKSFINTSTEALTINSAATLTVMDGMIYSHSNDGTNNFAFADATSTLELIGGTFRHPDAAAATLALSTGRMVVDHKSYIQPGNDNMTIASSLTIEVRPGATLNVTTGTDTSAGTVTFN